LNEKFLKDPAQIARDQLRRVMETYVPGECVCAQTAIVNLLLSLTRCSFFCIVRLLLTVMTLKERVVKIGESKDRQPRLLLLELPDVGVKR
jgi:hypothetical protein